MKYQDYKLQNHLEMKSSESSCINRVDNAHVVLKLSTVAGAVLESLFYRWWSVDQLRETVNIARNPITNERCTIGAGTRSFHPPVYCSIWLISWRIFACAVPAIHVRVLTYPPSCGNSFRGEGARNFVSECRYKNC